eukprot:TRINITY_DN5005_c0_g1_i1.p1 TRINITY_DN5005_c0_g1~~TRINITY_DN5005_c0_g1_i1.p1  ORF type:complete len:439 (+),score=104.24 TRINITY_DN5005_c0_g1_i1:1180-2496(+)
MSLSSVATTDEEASKATRSALYYVLCVDRLVHTTLQVALALEGDANSSAPEHGSEGEEDDSPFTILDVEEDATAKEIIGNAGLPFGTGCAFYEVVKSESVSKTKLIVVYDEKTNKWLENDDARKAIGLPIGKDGKATPKDGFRVFVQSTSPNRKIPAGSGLLYKSEAAIKPKSAKKSKKQRKGSDDEDEGGEDEMEVDEEGGGDDDKDGEDEDEDDDYDNDRRATPTAADLTNRGKLSLLSFYKASDAKRERVINFMNRVWFTAYFARPNLGADEFDGPEFAISQFVEMRVPGQNPSSEKPVAFYVGLNVEAQDNLGFDYYSTDCSALPYQEDFSFGLTLKPKRKCHVTTTAVYALKELGSVPSEIGMIGCDMLILFEKAVPKGDQRVFTGEGRIDQATYARAIQVLTERFVTIYGEVEAPQFVKSHITDLYKYPGDD